MSTSPDLCIIGAGALGIDLALYARRLGASVVLADRGLKEPGDSAQQALRMASLVESARRAQDLRRAADVGLGGGEMKLSAKAVAERATRLTEARERATSGEILSARGVTAMRGSVGFVDQRSLRIGDITIKPRNIVIAIGGAPIVPVLPGLDAIDFFTPDTIVENTRKLTHLVIIGGDAAAIEQAQLQRRLGAEVTLVGQGPVLAGFDPECAALLLDILSGEGIRFLPSFHVSTIKARSQGIGVEIDSEDGTRESLDASHILVSAGRQAALDELDIAKARLKTGTQPHSFLKGALGETSAGSIRLVGHAAGQGSWAEAQAHGRAVVEALLGTGRGAGAVRVPRLVETEPALAEIGMLAGRGVKPRAGEQIFRENFSENDRAAAMASDRGVLKVTVNAQGQLVRAGIVGPHAGELAGALSLALDKKLGIAGLADLPVPQPSLFGILKRLGENYLATRPVSGLEQRGRALRRLLRR